MITVKRAYEELERDGIIYRRQGLGTFVAEHGGRPQPRRQESQRARELLREALREATEAGLDRQGRRPAPARASVHERHRRAQTCPQTRLRSAGWRSAIAAFTLGPLDLTVPAGAIYGFVGPNGAGKTTTIDLIFGMGAKDAGSITVLGLDHLATKWR